MANGVIKEVNSIKFNSDWLVVNANSWFHYDLPTGMYIEEKDYLRFECQQNAVRHFENIVPHYLGDSSYIEIYNAEDSNIAIRFYIIN